MNETIEMSALWSMYRDQTTKVQFKEGKVHIAKGKKRFMSTDVMVQHAAKVKPPRNKKETQKSIWRCHNCVVNDQLFASIKNGII